MAFNPTRQTWDQVANKQSHGEMTYDNLNTNQLPIKYDPIYNTLVEEISYTMYRKLNVLQKWRNLGRTLPENQYPGIIRELYMMQRKGQDFPADYGTRPETLNSYPIFDDTITARYHSAQFRWMYGLTIWDEELRRFSGGNKECIMQLTEMKMMNMVNARNMFMDSIRKETLYTLISNVCIDKVISIDITNFAALTSEQARQWLNDVDNLLYELEIGSALYNKLGEYMQTPASDLQMIIPRDYYYNVVRRAYPDMYHEGLFQNVLPENLILIDNFGGETLVRNDAEVQPTYDAKGMSLLNWTTADTFKSKAPNVVAVIAHKDSMGFEDNLNVTKFGPQDAQKLATPVFSHFWTKAYVTDMLPAIKISKE